MTAPAGLAALRAAARSLLRQAWQTIVRRDETLVVFTYDPRQGDGALDGRVSIVGGRRRVPMRMTRQFVASRGSALWALIRLRMLIEDASLLCLAEDGRLLAYGMLRRCDPLPRRLRWLAPRGVILGPFWTAPEARGRRLYSVLLCACIATLANRRDMPLIVYADVTNAASINGLEHAGFARLGTWRVSACLLSLLHYRHTVDARMTIEDVWAQASPARDLSAGGGGLP